MNQLISFKPYQKMKSNSTIALKVFSAIPFLFVTGAIILIAQNPATGYELSIYSAMPPLVWVLLVTAIVIGISIVVYQVAMRDSERENWWQIGLLLVLLSNLVIVLLPYLKGYAFSACGDHLGHLGYVKGILQTGSFSAGNVYPITHILISQLSCILNISPERMINFAGPLFYLLFVLSTYLLSKEILPGPAAILATTASTVLFCYYYIGVFAMGFAFITFPLGFYLYFKYSKSKSTSLAILLIILIVLMVFFHPVASFMLTVALLVMELCKPLFDGLYIGKKECSDSSPSWAQQISLNLPILSLVYLLLWIWNNLGVWNNSISCVVSWFHFELLTAPMTETAIGVFSELGLGISGQLELFIKMYGHYFIYAVLSLIATIMIVRERISLPGKDVRGIFLFSCFFLPATAVWLIDYARPLTNLTSGRMICLVTALFPSFVGLALYRIEGMKIRKNIESTKAHLYEASRGKLIRTVAVDLVIIVCSLLGVFSVYRSPITLQANPAASYAQVAGEYWLLEQGEPSIKAVGLKVAPLHRFAKALWGARVIDYPHEDRDEHIPDHFNYAEYQSIGESFEGDRYMRLRERFIESFYSELRPQPGKFTEGDFSKLEGDFSVEKLYNNAEMQVWYVHALA